MLMIGDQEMEKLIGHERGVRHRRAVEVIAAGDAVLILREQF